MARPRENKFPLGNELFTSVTVWNGVPLIHIRHFKTIESPYPPHKTFQMATKSGVCMSEQQFRELIMTFPNVLSELDNAKASLVNAVKSEMKTPIRASTSFDGETYLHRAPVKMKPPVKPHLGDPEAEPLIKKMRLEGVMMGNDDPSDILNQAMKTIR